jgi:hypothetical protein
MEKTQTEPEMMVMMNKKTHPFLHISLYGFIISLDGTLISVKEEDQ